YSKVGAAGIWQFMPATGRRFMRVDHLVDERRDPISSTHAAAQFLGRVYDSLETWPLTITAYNHGPDGMARAVDETGTSDIGTIVREYHGRAFGFASRNFYAEFLAALDVERDAKTYFGDLPAGPPLRWREHRLDRSIGIEAAARLARTDRIELASMNPALSSLVVQGRRPIPAGYRLRLPDGGAGFESRVAEFAAEQQVTRVAAPAVAKARPAVRSAVLTYRVRRGRTVSRAAAKRKVVVASAKSRKAPAKKSKQRAVPKAKVRVAQKV